MCNLVSSSSLLTQWLQKLQLSDRSLKKNQKVNILRILFVS